MKRQNTVIYICVIITLLNVAGLLFIACKSNSPIATASTPVQSSTSGYYSDAYMPEALTFAGETVPLQRLDVQEALRKELIVNSYLHSHTIQILQTAPRVFQLMEPILEKNGIPEDFKYLAVIESRLNPQAQSPAGAVGVWQFLKGTGKENGLEINNEVDERYHIEKSTEAAAAYLKNYYNLLLGEETERYVFRILALKQIMNHPELYNFKVNTVYTFEKTETVEVKGPVKSWADFAQEQGITYKTLKRFNPWLRKTDLKNPQHKTYTISIPKKKELYK